MKYAQKLKISETMQKVPAPSMWQKALQMSKKAKKKERPLGPTPKNTIYPWRTLALGESVDIEVKRGVEFGSVYDAIRGSASSFSTRHSRFIVTQKVGKRIVRAWRVV